VGGYTNRAMWANWAVAVIGLLLVGAIVISLFLGGLIFGVGAALVVGIVLLLAAAARRAGAASEGAGAGLSSSPSDKHRFGEGAKDRASAVAAQPEEPR
jgi:hypothetical protein